MLRKVYISALQGDAERRPIWITPQQAVGAARGRGCALFSRTAKQFNSSGVVETWHAASLPPSCAYGLLRGYPNWTPFGVSL
jgi:hypothetical protein